MDALLELRAALAGYHAAEDWAQTPATPREAARMLFNVPKAGLIDLTEKERRALAENLVLMLEESGDTDHPTVMIEDRGIGVLRSKRPAAASPSSTGVARVEPGG